MVDATKPQFPKLRYRWSWTAGVWILRDWRNIRPGIEQVIGRKP